MKKNYKEWCLLKQLIELKSSEILFQKQEIWWCSLGTNIGVEQDGKNHYFERPVLIFKRFNGDIFLGFPITSKKKVGYFYYSFKINNIESTIILSQIKALSSKRLIRKMGKVSDKEFSSIKKAVYSFLK